MTENEPKAATGNPHPRNPLTDKTDATLLDPNVNPESESEPNSPNQPQTGNSHPRNTP